MGFKRFTKNFLTALAWLIFGAVVMVSGIVLAVTGNVIFYSINKVVMLAITIGGWIIALLGIVMIFYSFVQFRKL